MLLLPAPPPMKLLCAPRIAGLLPERVPLKIEVIFEEKPLTWEEKVAIFRQMPRLRTREEMNAELAPLALKVVESLHRTGVHGTRNGGQHE
ncbi:MAG: hypothetical protein ABI947_29165 [Chloroflexota bacterium]